jgi:ABC-2 type transport system ATP-binding protein
MSEHNPILAVRGVQRLHKTKQGERVGVHEVTFELPPGQWVALLGPNGSGKSTLLRLIATADWVQRGEIELAGVRVHRGWSTAERDKARRSLGVVFQAPALDPLLTVRENLAAAASLLGLAGRAASDRVEHLMAVMDITDRARDLVGRLSGGLKRRADLARAMLGSPRLLVLDEPTVGLDPDARGLLLRALRELHAGESPPAILHSTHLTEEAEQADRVLFMHRGRIAADATPASLREQLGERTLILEGDPDEATRCLASLGLDARRAGSARVMASGDEPSLERAAVELSRAGRSFSVGTPTLADAYSALVGRGLADNGETP